MTKVIGLTGGIASGKSTVGNILREEKYTVIDLDQTVHSLETENEEVINRIASLFGPDVISDGKVNRSKLAAIVFNDKKAMKELIKILNPFLINEIHKQLTDDLVIVEAPTLFENGLQVYVDEIVMVTCDPVVQMQRLQKRDDLSISKANKLISSQWPQVIKRELSDLVIDSSNGIVDLKKQVKEIINNLR
ncbi:dephospho-CoA kinase [Fructilactobacillus sp. Tb1]|uniref:dephospho-CoA kinase n=1 Tax=Fructilactobacillus sp. Tb1 TaxID=3422304 RepID=UPI003D26E85D